MSTDVSFSAPKHGTVIKSMVERFRFGSPLSRAERAKMRESTSNQPEFWWKSGGDEYSMAGVTNGDEKNVGAVATTTKNNENNNNNSIIDSHNNTVFDPNISFASFLPDTQSSATYRYGSTSNNMPQTPSGTGRPVMDV